MTYSELIHYLSEHHDTDMKGNILNKLKDWVNTNIAKNRLYVSFIIKVLGEVQFDPLQINPDVLNKLKIKYKWHYRVSRINHLRRFLKWLECGVDPRLISLAKKLLPPLDCKLQDIPLHPNIERYLLKIQDSVISPNTKENIKQETRICNIYHFRLFNNFVFYIDPNCPRDSFNSYTEKHAREFKLFLENESTRYMLTGNYINNSYVYKILSTVKASFNRAYENEYSNENPFRRIKIKHYNESTSNRPYLKISDYERITFIDKTMFYKMHIRKRYGYLFPRIIIKLCFEAGLRITTCLHLMIEDIRIAEIYKGYIPIYIYGAKSRSTNHLDIIWIKYERIKDIYNLFLQTRAEFLKFCDINDLPVCSEENQNIGHPLAINPSSGKWCKSSNTFSHYYEVFLIENGLGEFKTKTHICRRGLVTHLYNIGWSPDEIMLITKHKTLKDVKRYDRGDYTDNRNRIIAAEARHAISVSSQKAITENDINFHSFKFAEWLKTKKYLSADSVDINELIMQFDRDRLLDEDNDTDKDNYYDLNSLKHIWNLSKTQSYQRCQYLIEAQLIHPCENHINNILIPKWEIDNFNLKYIELTKAAIYSGYRSKGKMDYLRKLASKQIIKSIRIGKLIFLERISFENWLSNKHRKTNE